MSWLRRLLHRSRLEKELSAELRFHFDQQVVDHVRAGMNEEEARRTARLEFGGLDQVAEECRDARGTLWLENVWRDARLACRLLAKDPGFTAAALLTLALGIGATTAVFSVLKTVLLDQLRYRDPGLLVMVAEANSRTKDPKTVSFPTAYDWRERSRSFESVSISGDLGGVRPIVGGQAQFLRGLSVTYNYFDTLGVPMCLGRSFLPEEDTPSKKYELILSYGLWMRLFGGDPTVIGRALPSISHDRIVVGVLPRDFAPMRMSNPGEIPEVYAPLGYTMQWNSGRSACNLQMIARLKPGVSAGQAQAELRAMMRDLVRQYPQDYPRDSAPIVRPLREAWIGRFGSALWALLGMAGMLLLLACANIASLQLARGAGRQTEMAMRAALGAGRWRLVRQVLTESAILGLCGGMAGTALAWAARGPLVI